MTTISEGVHDERTARIMLSMLSEPNDSVTGRLLTDLGGIETIRLLDRDDFPPIAERVETQMWRRTLQAQASTDLLRKIDLFQVRGHGTLIPGDTDWPAALNDLHERAPYVLWTVGASSFLNRPKSDHVTLTGARAATAYGEHVAAEFASDLSKEKKVIVSGGAYGIESAAHRAALATGGDAIAVLATGVDRTYPHGQKDLLERIRDVGLVVSELPPETTPTKWRFLARSRVLAALSSATVIVEAGYRSGSLSVARHAHTLGRGVGAVPGPITSAASAGAHRLLSENMARIVTNSQDVVDLIERGTDRQPRPPQKPLGPEFTARGSTVGDSRGRSL